MQALGARFFNPVKPAGPARLSGKPGAPLLPGYMTNKLGGSLSLPHASNFPNFSGDTHPFVRPDLPASDDEEYSAPYSRWPRQPPAEAVNNILDKGGIAAETDKIRFRSALEQVSYHTNKQMMGSVDDEPSNRKGGFWRK